MKSLNTMKFVSNAISNLTEYKTSIATAKTYESARQIANRAIGYIDCLNTFNNTMICHENNDFTPEFGEVLEGWMHSIFQVLADKADETHQDHDIIWKLLQMRDECQPM